MTEDEKRWYDALRESSIFCAMARLVDERAAAGEPPTNAEAEMLWVWYCYLGCTEPDRAFVDVLKDLRE